VLDEGIQARDRCETYCDMEEEKKEMLLWMKMMNKTWEIRNPRSA